MKEPSACWHGGAAVGQLKSNDKHPQPLVLSLWVAKQGLGPND